MKDQASDWEGASGLVYKGISKDKRTVAVKRLAELN